MLLALTLLACQRPEPLESWQTLETAEAMAERGAALWAPESLYFGWMETVWSWGMHRLYAVTGDPTWQDYYRAWLDENAGAYTGEDARAFNASDEMSPALLAATLMLEDPSGDYTMITEAADAYLSSATRTSQGAIAHWSAGSAFGDTVQIWVESQFMFGAYLVQQHRLTGDESYLDTYLAQYALFSELCRDPEDQLYRHAWDDEIGENIPADDTYWARGNAWVLVSAGELITRLGLEAPASQELLDPYRRHAAAIAGVQAEDGLWRTVMNAPRGEDPDNYTETSASALIVYGLILGVRSGALDAAAYGPVIDAGLEGVLGRIDDRGDGELVVEGTSLGTNPGGYDDYVAVETFDDILIGVGAVIMALSEADGMERSTGG